MHEIPVGWPNEAITQRRQGDAKVKDKASAASATPYEFGGRPQTMEGSSSNDSYLESPRSAQRKLFDEHIKLTEMDLAHYKRVMEKRFKQLGELNPIEDPLGTKKNNKESQGGDETSARHPAPNRSDGEATKRDKSEKVPRKTRTVYNPELAAEVRPSQSGSEGETQDDGEDIMMVIKVT